MPSGNSIESLIKLKMIVIPSEFSIETLLKVMNSGSGLWRGNGALEGYLIPSQVSLETLKGKLKMVTSTAAQEGFSPRC